MQNSTELGYVLAKEDLNAKDYDAAKSSIRSLARWTGLSCEELIVGEQSFGGFLEREGYNAVPSPRQKYPGEVHTIRIYGMVKQACPRFRDPASWLPLL